MSVFLLKIIAIVAMLIDHIAAVFVNSNTELYLIMRAIGRIAFPIFCFLIVEGYFHTRNVYKYMTRLAIFALISEIPFNLCFYRTTLEWSHQNVFFTLFIGLLAIFGIELVKKAQGIYDIRTIILQFVIIILAMGAAAYLKTDYSMLGILIVICFYVNRGNLLQIAIAMFVITFCLGNRLQLFSLLALIPIYLYNGQKGRSMKYFFYVFYPAHLMILYLIAGYTYAN